MSKLYQPLADLKNADLPAKTRPNWKLTGPGAVLVGLSIGAGEIIIWPRIAAEYGATMVWAAVLGVFLQMWINFEIGRWTIATGETIYTGFVRIWRGFAPLFIALTFLAWLAPGWGQASGLALKALLVGPDWHLDTEGHPIDLWGTKTFWTTVTFMGVAAVLFGPKLIYRSVERTVEALVIVVVIGLIVVAVAVGTPRTWADLGNGIVKIGAIEPNGKRRLDVDATAGEQLDLGIVSPRLREALRKALDLSDDSLGADVAVVTIAISRDWLIEDGARQYKIVRNADVLLTLTPRLTAKAFFIALVFAGAGGTANLFYSFYLRDKKIGMGARLPSMQNPLRGRTEKIPATGFRFPDTDENRRRFRSWWGFVCQDQVLYFWLLNTFTILLFIFGSLAVLHPEGIVPGSDTLIFDQAVVLGGVWGQPGTVIFLLVGVATLFSTQLALIDGVSRSIADIIYTNVRQAQKREVGWWYLLVAGGWIVLGCGITAMMERWGVTNLGFLFNAAYMGGFAMAIYVPLTLWINLRYLPKSARPGLVCRFMMIVATCVYAGFAVSCIVWEITSRIGAS